MRNTLSWIGLGIIAAGITFLVIVDVFTGIGGVRGDQIASLVWAVALLIVIGGGTIGSYRGKSTTALQHFAIWLAILAVIALVYNYRAELGINFD